MNPFREKPSAGGKVLFRFPLLVVLGLISPFVSAQKLSKRDLPYSVQNAFQIRYPEARKMDWSLVREYEYGVEFVFRNRKGEAWFQANGNWRGTRWTCPTDSVPGAILDSARIRLPQIRKLKAFLWEGPNEKQWHFPVWTGEASYIFRFDNQGRFLRKEREAD